MRERVKSISMRCIVAGMALCLIDLIAGAVTFFAMLFNVIPQGDPPSWFFIISLLGALLSTVGVLAFVWAETGGF